MTELLLVRHAETEWNREGRWQGHADPPLNEAGRAQAHALARSLAGEPVDAIYSSDLLRAAETAEILAAALGRTVIPDPDLREIDVGSWSGLTREEVAVQFPGWETHDGESPDLLLERVVGAVGRIAQHHPGGRVLIVTHGGSIRSLERYLYGATQGVMANCGLKRIVLDA